MAREGSSGGLRTDWGKMLVIGMMYMAEVFPSGFTGSLVPTLYRKAGLPLQQFWIFSLPVLPYWLRWAIAPVIDTYWSPRLGRRKSWIAPFTILAVATYASLAFFSPTIAMLHVIVAILFVKTLFTATQEVAIDAYVVDNVLPHERPAAAAAHVVSEAVAQMLALAGLGLIVQRFGWSAGAVCAATLMLIFLAPALLRKEAAPPADALLRLGQAKTLRVTFAPLGRFLSRRDTWLLMPMLMFSGVFTGAMIPIMGPFLVDQGLSVAQIGLTVGVVLGLGALAGATASIGVVAYVGVRRLLILLAIVAPVSVIPVTWMAYAHPHLGQVFLAGALFLPVLVTSVFYVTFLAVRLAAASASQSGTDYATASAFTRIAQTVAGGAGGPIAAAVGWHGFFILLGLVGLVGIGGIALIYAPFIRQVTDRNAAIQALAVA